jgi:HlyD family secretion protein
MSSREKILNKLRRFYPDRLSNTAYLTEFDSMSETQPEQIKADDLPSAKMFMADQRRNPYSVGISWLIWSGLLGLIGGGSWLGYQTFFHHPQAAIAVSVTPVARGDVEITVTESGSVALGGQQTLKSPREVTIEQVNVKAGDFVKRGQALLVLRDREVQERISDQRVVNAKLNLTLNRAREKVIESQKRLKTAEDRFQESQGLLNQGFISETDLQSDREKMDDARSALKDVQVDQASAELDVRNGQEKLQGLEQQLSDRTVTAPINGIVLSLEVKNGDGANVGSDLLTLGDPSQEMIILQLTTLNAAKTRINQVAKISMIGPNSKTFTGRVVSLSPQATSPSSEGYSGGSDSGQAKVDAQVLLDRPSDTLIPGSLVSVEIITSQRRAVIAIPPEAIQRTEANPFVWVRDAQGKAKQQPVQIGLEGLETVEITSGLKTGDQLVLPPPDAVLTPGAPLAIDQSQTEAAPPPESDR